MQKSYIDVIHDYRQGKICCWTRDMDGNLEYEEHDECDYSYLFVPDNTGNTKFVDIYKKPMKQLFFDSYQEMKDYAKLSSICHESDIPPVYKFLLDQFMDAPTNAPYNVGLYDIEVDFDLDDGRGYPSIENPFGKINSISLFDVSTKTYYMLMLTGHTVELKDKEFPVKNFTFLCEKNLLKKFAEIIDDLDILAGWNTEFFDLNYIMERLIKNFGESVAVTMLCRGGFKAKKKSKTSDFDEDLWIWELKGRKHLDMMAIYKKFKPKGLESTKLSAICLKELGLDKIDYDGDLGSLYRENPEKFFEYSLHDSRLLYMLDKKLNLISTTMMFTRFACVLAEEITGTVKPIEHAFIKFCRKKGNIVLPDKKEHKKEDFKGAVVYNTIAGLKKRLFSIDLTALYPSVMIMLGMSEENLLMQLKGEEMDYYKVIQRYDEEVVAILQDGSEMTFKAYELDDIIRESGYTISGAGTIFDGTLGLIAEFVKEGFDLRTEYKSLMKQAFERGDTDEGVKYNLLQSVMKLRNNSTYGALANEFFRLFNIRLARSITYTGALVSKFMTYKTNETLKELEHV